MISSTSNTKIKNVVSLRKSARERRKQGSFLVEGPRMFFETPVSRIKEVYVTAEFEKKYAESMKRYRYELVSENVLRHLADTKNPQGVVAVVQIREFSLEDMLSTDLTANLILLENLQDPGNMGTIFRTAEAAGVSGIIAGRETVDIYNPKVIRSTMGAVYRIPFLVTEDFPGMIGRLKSEGIHVYAAHLDGRVYFDYDYNEPCAFLIGNEGNGLTKESTSLADHRIRIPMEGETESLNAAVAASLIMYEVMRQRKY